MPSVFHYLDYRVFLREYYNDHKIKDAFFSYRYMANKVGMDAGYVVKILQEKVHLASKHLDIFVKFCQFDKKEAEYFKLLVQFNKAKHESQTKVLYEKLLTLTELPLTKLHKDQFEYYSKWYYSAIRALIPQINFTGDYKFLGSLLSPEISENDAKKAVKLLVSVGLIHKNAEGIYKISGQIISTGSKWQSTAIKNFQKETIKMAEESLDRHILSLRDISTVTLGIAQKDIPEIRERVAALRKSLIKLANETTDADSVYQLNIQLFPFSYKNGVSE